MAIVGMAARVPGAEDSRGYWDLLNSGQTMIAPVPDGRLRGFSPDMAGVDVPWAALWADTDDFDPSVFGISPRLAAWIDPQQRLLLEASWHALESAGIPPSSLGGSDTAVYVSTTASDWRQVMADEGLVDRYSALGLLLTYLSSRISYQYDLRGPSLTIDTACSGGLTAVALAVSGLRSGDYRTAIAASANLYLHGFMHAVMMRFGALSPTGQARSFDDAANGYVRGEGVFCFVLKRLSDALSDGDPVLAVIRGCSLNHDGRAGGMTLTDPASLARLMQTALAQAGVDVADLGYVEAHAAGTPLGDAQEVHGLLHALRDRPGGMPNQGSGPEQRLWVGSVKSSIGHLEGSAGAASLAKAVHVLRHRSIPPTPGFADLNHRIDLAGTPVAIAQEAVPWPDGSHGPRLVGVNSFGVGGANAHVVLEEPPRQPHTETGHGDQAMPVPLSAATDAALMQLAGALAAVSAEGPSFDAVTWTLQTGRESMRSRQIVVAQDIDELREALTALAEGTADSDALAAQTARLSAEGARLASVWLAGDEVDWSALWQHRIPPRRVELASYPFQRRRFPFPPAARER
ncbi:polyketide synthase [Catellatospora coxensis]|uniref:polyketide synthase n=1 Tax=Catellatospora coxensis TaxID=310354 RepID=UPI001941D3AE|nr:polyketide synthase [Catellatospora coxensis]